jgi:hypothetical protein
MELMNTMHEYQRSSMDSPELRERAITAGIGYLVKHRVWRENNINMLQYEADISVSRQHVEMIRMMNTLFPGIVVRFNDGSLLDTSNESRESEIAKELYANISALATSTMGIRWSEESKYALKQWAIFAWAAAVVGWSIGAAVHGIFSGSSGEYVWVDTPGSTITRYPDSLDAYTKVTRGFWYDNTTPSPEYDHTELMIQADTSGNWNVRDMIAKVASSTKGVNHTISPVDFTGSRIQAVVTPIKGGPSFILPIDANGNIEIPPSMKWAFDNRSFAFLEVGEVEKIAWGELKLNPIATVVGKWDMVFDKITQVIPWTQWKKWVPDNSPSSWSGIPFGMNKYHELKKQQKKPSLGQLPKNDDTPPSDKNNTTIVPPIVPISPNIAEKIAQENPIQDAPPTKTGDIQKTPTLDADRLELDDLWSQLVKLRQILERRKSWDIALSEAAVANMLKTEKDLFALYTKKRQAYNKKQASTIEPPLNRDIAIVATDKALSETEETNSPTGGSEQMNSSQYDNSRIDSLIARGILATDINGKPMILNWHGRIIIAVRTSNGWILPFYRSAHGTSGKVAWNWYPCFGITDDDVWLIKKINLSDITTVLPGAVEQINTLQTTLNNELNWNTDLDRDFVWNRRNNPLVQAGATQFDIWAEESKQSIAKPTGNKDSAATIVWILDWIERVTDRDKWVNTAWPTTQAPVYPAVSPAHPSVGTNNSMNTMSSYDKLEQDYDAAIRGLGRYSPDIDSVIRVGFMNNSQNPNFMLSGWAHTTRLAGILNRIKDIWATRAMNAIITLYGKNGKIWLSEKTHIGQSSTTEGNIAIGLIDNPDDQYSLVSHRLYEISGMQNIPDNNIIKLLHELGHKITLRSRRDNGISDDMRAMLSEVQELRYEQWSGITPLSSMSFYKNQVTQPGYEDVQFWEDMAELMGLYLVDRTYVERYLDDRIRVARDMKANITAWLRDRMMTVLDNSYNRYISGN